MIKVVLAVLTCLFLIGNAPAQGKESSAHNSKTSLTQALKSVGITGDYDARYTSFILPLCQAGIDLFTDGCSISKDDPMHCYCYSGTEEQNHKLTRNIIRNRKLFVKGRIPEENYKKWITVP